MLRTPPTEHTSNKCALYSILLLLQLNLVQGWLWSKSTKTVCYDKIGCFSSKKPFDNAINNVPSSPGKIDPEFLFYTIDNVDQPLVIKFKTQNTQIPRSQFNRLLPTKFIIHGYKSNGRKGRYQSLKNELLKKEPMNVFVVNWQKGAKDFNYLKAAANTRVVGALIAEIVKALEEYKNADRSTFHLIGHSLGAHVAGYAGARLPNLGRITGLDPAGLAFSNSERAVRLDDGDANFVDVIHTDAEPLIKLGFGTGRPLGHVDFYPNHGRNQPGCVKNNWKNVEKLFSTGNDDALACSHMRAIQLFSDSINVCQFHCRKCVDKDDALDNKCNREVEKGVFMGLDTSSHTRGVYDVDTNSVSPFCK